MAKPPWARLTKPIRPMVTDRPTDTMNRTIPAATPPRSMLATSMPRITRAPTGASRGRGGAGSLPGARPDLLLLALILHRVDLADGLLGDVAVLHHDLRQVLVHHDVAGDRVDRDGPARTVELPALQGVQRLVGVDLALEGLDHVHDGRHPVVAADGHEVRRGAGAVLLLPRLDEPLVLRVVEVGVVVVHGDEADRRRAHGLELRVLGDVAGADQLDAGVLHAERGVGLDDRGGVVA